MSMIRRWISLYSVDYLSGEQEEEYVKFTSSFPGPICALSEQKIMYFVLHRQLQYGAHESFCGPSQPFYISHRTPTVLC